MLIVCGLSGAGKSTFGEIATSKQIDIVEGSSTVAELFHKHKRRDEDIIGFCRRWFSERGGDIFAKENVRRMTSNRLEFDRLVFIGCRHAEEITYLKEVDSKARAIGIYADESSRFKRCLKRDRADKLADISQFVRRDMRELEMGLAGLLAYALDGFIMNNESLAAFEASASREIETYFAHLS